LTSFSRGSELDGGIPQVPGEIDAAFVGEANTLAPQSLFHHVGPGEMARAAEGSEAIHDAVARIRRGVCSMQRPPYRTRTAAEAEVSRDVTVRRDASVGNPLDDLQYAGEEIRAFLHFRPILRANYGPSAAATRTSWPG
jgi:hypothetical protein